jgi:hypothetical protein
MGRKYTRCAKESTSWLTRASLLATNSRWRRAAPRVVGEAQGAKVFSALALCSGFYQIPLDSELRPYTAFSTPQGLYQWCVMPMGLSNSPGAFQHAMTSVLPEHICAGYC